MKIFEKKLKVQLVVLSILITGLSLNAQPANGNCTHHQKHEHKCCAKYSNESVGRPCDRMSYKMKILDLSDEQNAKIKEIHTKHMESQLPLKNSFGEKKAKLKTLTTAGEVNMKEVEKLIEEIGEIKVQLMKNKVYFKQEIRKILTKEQRLKFDMKKSCSNKL